ncbi:hypothetical protein GCM10027591_10540 [Zhihengliuella somnathii]
MSHGEETRRHARTRWVIAGVIGGTVLLIALLIALIMTVLAPGSTSPGGQDTPSASSDVAPVSPSTSPAGSPTTGPSSGSVPTPPELGGPVASEPQEAEWIDEEAGTIRVYTFGSSSCPAKFESVEVLAADEIRVNFNTDYGQTACTMDYAATEHVIAVPDDAPGRPLMVSLNVQSSSVSGSESGPESAE